MGTVFYGKMCEHRKYYKSIYIYIYIYLEGAVPVSVPGQDSMTRCVNSVSNMRFNMQGVVLGV